MPGYVMHLAQAQIVINELKKHRDLSEDWIHAFMTGNLLPDTRLFGDKVISHFWDPSEDANLERAPKLNLFMDKYEALLDQPVMLGYLMHLHLDREYVEHYWPGMISFYDAQGQPEKIREKIAYVKIHRTGEEVPLNDFFSPTFYYGDYSRMNDHFIKTYQLTMPKWQCVHDFPMTEVKLEDMAIVCGHLTKLLDEFSGAPHQATKVFNLPDLEAFIERTAKAFMAEYMQL